MNKPGKIIAISISSEKGIPKTNIPQAELIDDWGIDGDVHAGKWHRQVSLLAVESITKMKDKGFPDIQPGSFAENITTEFINLPVLEIGTKLTIGESILEVTQIGKECNNHCAIFHAVGDCVMPREGVFAKVLKGGIISVNDNIEIKLEES